MFDYIGEKIRAARLIHEPFSHLYIDELLLPEHFEAVLNAPEILIPTANSDEDLLHKLATAGYSAVPFPGCVTSDTEYLAWRKGKCDIRHHPTSEGAGMTLRLQETRTPAVLELKAYFQSDEFNGLLVEKFGLQEANLTRDFGIQKYLDGYEISPHPDSRKKALTYMLNINPHAQSEELEHHTHYLRLKANRAYIETFWEGNTEVERCFVPWSWCESAKTQSANNSLVIFQPSNRSLHAVRARYDHLKGQRTQIYGNLWHREDPSKYIIEFNQLDLLSGERGPITNFDNNQLGRVRNFLARAKRANFLQINRDRRKNY